MLKTKTRQIEYLYNGKDEDPQILWSDFKKDISAIILLRTVFSLRARKKMRNLVPGHIYATQIFWTPLYFHHKTYYIE